MFGDYLRKNIELLTNTSTKKTDKNAFWNVLKHIAIEDIIAVSPSKIDSDIAVPLYYSILMENEDKIPPYFKKTLKSNGQPRYRVINRNMFTSNAFHKDGIANQPNIKAEKTINESRKGCRIIYQGVK